MSAVIVALQKAGVDQSKYCGHSFQIGVAITAAVRGMEDSIIKTEDGKVWSIFEPPAYSKVLCS